MRHTISIVVLLAFIWLVNSGHYTPLILFLGAVSIAFVAWLTHKMDVVDHESQPVHLTAKLPLYYWWLLIKIIKSNIDVVKHIWRPTLAITPTVATLDASQKTDMGLVVYANSITLTPGTVALDVQGGKIKVHSLTKQGIDDLLSGEMDRKVTGLE